MLGLVCAQECAKVVGDGCIAVTRVAHAFDEIRVGFEPAGTNRIQQLTERVLWLIIPRHTVCLLSASSVVQRRPLLVPNDSVLHGQAAWLCHNFEEASFFKRVQCFAHSALVNSEVMSQARNA